MTHSADAGQSGARSAQVRARDLGLRIGMGIPGPLNSITDVPGVGVGHATIIDGDGPLRQGKGPIRTGVTVVRPTMLGQPTPVYAGSHTLNGNGEFTGLEWIRESGLLTTDVAITNTHSVGVVRDALVAWAVTADRRQGWVLPVVAETYDGLLNDINGFHVRSEHVLSAVRSATGGRVHEGNVGGGTGMICHEFKGGIGTASRVLRTSSGGYAVGVLLQANHGKREWLRIDGMPLGRQLSTDVIPSPFDALANSDSPGERPGTGSVVAIVATDAPLLPHQCQRIARRAGLGIARAGATAAHSSGDFFLAFATGNRLPAVDPLGALPPVDVKSVGDAVMDDLFDAVIEATEEAVLNAMVAATSMVGRDGITAHRLPHSALRQMEEIFERGAGYPWDRVPPLSPGGGSNAPTEREPE